MRIANRLALLAALPLLVSTVPAQASADSTIVTRGFTHTEFFPDDICGDRASTVTFTEKMAQSRDVQLSDGSWTHRDVAVVTYDVDFVDPALADYSGRLTEVNHFTFKAPDAFIASTTYQDFGGDLKIWERTNIKVVNDEVVVDRYITRVTGCP